jgi:hypothetical protein
MGLVGSLLEEDLGYKAKLSMMLIWRAASSCVGQLRQPGSCPYSMLLTQRQVHTSAANDSKLLGCCFNSALSSLCSSELHEEHLVSPAGRPLIGSGLCVPRLASYH